MGRISFGRVLFARGLFVRIVAVLSGLLVASFVAFPSFPSAGFLAFTHAMSVDRTLKGDRLPVDFSTNKTEAPSAAQALRHEVPIGCDRAFSPISAPRLANVFRRCAA